VCCSKWVDFSIEFEGTHETLVTMLFVNLFSFMECLYGIACFRYDVCMHSYIIMVRMMPCLIKEICNLQCLFPGCQKKSILSNRSITLPWEPILILNIFHCCICKEKKRILSKKKRKEVNVTFHRDISTYEIRKQFINSSRTIEMVLPEPKI
jgi:hypothetical protein